MEKLYIRIEASRDHFGAYAENVEGIWGSGDSLEACKEDVARSIAQIASCPDPQVCPVPDWLRKGDYEIEYLYDTQSLLAHYSGIFTKAALERITGINQKQLHHYASGISKPRPAQRAKINEGLHRLGRELLSVDV